MAEWAIRTTSKSLFFIDIITRILNQPSYPLEASPGGCDYHEEDDEDDANANDSAVQMKKAMIIMMMIGDDW